MYNIYMRHLTGIILHWKPSIINMQVNRYRNMPGYRRGVGKYRDDGTVPAVIPNAYPGTVRCFKLTL